ncbi:NADH-quinone oxidoreductase subunit L [Buchnera aphidicola (Eriosoma lanigerum)]|uniref:NADH-quinone oxidoreductase subunit L n=1 Tax=Buchnera aphidicola TaxID=9 RepID=UPI003464D0D4
MNMIFLVFFFPCISFFILSLFQKKLSQCILGIIGITSILFSSCIVLYLILIFFYGHSQFYIYNFFSWIDTDNLKINFSFLLDSLSVTMLGLVSIVGLLIHIFSYWYMKCKNDNARFFAYMNLFMLSMFILVLADNLVLMYLGWEGVGVCSYLLISFYYNHNINFRSAMKAFIITRIGDIFLLISIIILYTEFGTVDFISLNFLSNSQLICHNKLLYCITGCLLLGSIGKSAQFPLQTWLSDAMVGPTPVSALIHAATMITAGVYLIVRTHFLFILTPIVLYIIGIIGCITLVISSFSALVQTDIKKILAYSTMNQISYMFLALSVEAWQASILHLIAHAIFKALLFLSAGSLIIACKNEKNIFKMGGSIHQFPFLYFCFLIGGASLISLPIVTLGFYTKENILFSLLNSHHIFLFTMGLLGGLITSIYTFRMIFSIFNNSNIDLINKNSGFMHDFPLIVLVLFSSLFGVLIFSIFDFMLPEQNTVYLSKFVVSIITSVFSILGLVISYYCWIKNIELLKKCLKNTFFSTICLLFSSGFGFDYIYSLLFKKSYIYISKLFNRDPLGIILSQLEFLSCFCNKFLLISENGKLRWYICSFMIGILLFFFIIESLNF